MKANDVIDPMQAFLAGSLAGMLMKDGKEFMKIVEIAPGNLSPTGFEVSLASGLRLGVKVEVLGDAPDAPR